jgi:hypothetical protein
MPPRGFICLGTPHPSALDGQNLLGRDPRRQVVTIRPDFVLVMSEHKQSIRNSPETESPCLRFADPQRGGDPSD